MNFFQLCEATDFSRWEVSKDSILVAADRLEEDFDEISLHSFSKLLASYYQQLAITLQPHITQSFIKDASHMEQLVRQCVHVNPMNSTHLWFAPKNIFDDLEDIWERVRQVMRRYNHLDHLTKRDASQKLSQLLHLPVKWFNERGTKYLILRTFQNYHELYDYLHYESHAHIDDFSHLDDVHDESYVKDVQKQLSTPDRNGFYIDFRRHPWQFRISYDNFQKIYPLMANDLDIGVTNFPTTLSFNRKAT